MPMVVLELQAKGAAEATQAVKSVGDALTQFATVVARSSADTAALAQAVAKAEATMGQLRPTTQADADNLRVLQQQVTAVKDSLGAMTTATQQTATATQQGATSIKQFEQTVQSSSQAVKGATQDSRTWQVSLLDLAKAGAVMGLGFQGISTIAGWFRDAMSSTVQFQQAMANVNTLVLGSTQVQAQLRTELLQLPPILGSATELAKGLYQVLSAGVEPAKAVAFLKESALLAKAGLADLDTATIALTKTMAAYKIPVEQASAVSDVLFKAVEVGQGTLQQFAQAMPQVTQLAAAMGVNFKDTAAVMATLSQTFKSTDTAATGFASLLRQLSQNSAEFLALGIDIKKVISEEGIIGAIRILQQVTGGSSERLRKFVQDAEGVNAALALMGPQFQTLIEAQRKMGEAAGVVGKAVKEQTQTAGEAWTALVSSLDKLAQQLAPPFLGAFAAIVQGAVILIENLRTLTKTVINLFTFKPTNVLPTEIQKTGEAAKAAAENVKLLDDAFRDTTDRGERVKRALENVKPTLEGNTIEYTNLGTTLGVVIPQMDTVAKKAEAQKNAFDESTKTLTGFNTALNNIKKSGEIGQIIPTEELQKNLKTVINSLGEFAESGILSNTQVRQAFVQTEKTIRETQGTGSQTYQDLIAMWSGWEAQVRNSTGVVSKEVAQAAAVQAAAAAQAKQALEGEAQARLAEAQVMLQLAESKTVAERKIAQAAVDTAKQAVLSAREQTLAAEQVALAKQKQAVQADLTVKVEERNARLIEINAKMEANAVEQAALAHIRAGEAALAAARQKQVAAETALRLVAAQREEAQAVVQGAQAVVAAAESRLQAALVTSRGVIDANVRMAQGDVEAAKQALFAAQQKELAAQQTALAYKRVEIASDTSTSTEVRNQQLAANAAQQAALAREKGAAQAAEGYRQIQQSSQTAGKSERERIDALREGFTDTESGITKFSDGLSLNISRVKDLSFTITGMAASVGLWLSNTPVIWEKMGSDIATVTRQMRELEAAQRRLYTDLIQWQFPGTGAFNWINKGQLEILGQLGKRLHELMMQWARDTTDVQALSVAMARDVNLAFAALGIQTGQALKAAAEKAIAAFQAIQRSGTLTGEALQELFVRNVLPAIQQAYGRMTGSIMAMNMTMVDAVAAALDFLGAKSDKMLRDEADAAKRAFEIIKAAGAATGQNLEDIWTNDVLPKIEKAYGKMADKIVDDNKKIRDSAMEAAAAVGLLVPTSVAPPTGPFPGPPSDVPYVPPLGPGPASYQHGTAYVPRTAWYQLHQGEQVVPRGMPQGQPGRDVAGPIQVTFGQITVQVQGDAGGRAPQQLGRDVEEALDKAIRAGRFTYQMKRALGL